MTARPHLLALILGVTAGLAGGLFGVGGGIVVVPGLVLLLGMPPHRAHPTSVAAIIATAAAALSRFAIGDSVDWSAALVLFAGSGVGAFTGASVLDRISARWLTRAFVAVLLVTSVRLLIVGSGESGEGFVTAVELTPWAAIGLFVAGLTAGLLAATLGGGGGLVFVPTLAALFAVEQHVAQGTSLAVMVPTTLVAAVAHGVAGRVDWRMAAAIGAGGVAGGLAGAELALALDATLLRRLFALFLLLVAVRMFLRAR